MEQTITIKRADARKAYEEADIKLKPVLETLFGKDNILPVTERIKTWQDVLAYHQTDDREFDDGCDLLSTDEVAYRKCKMIAEALNEGWKPDWSNGSEAKWFAYMEYNGSGFRFVISGNIRQYSAVGSRLCFKSQELSNYYGTQFAPLINKFFL